MIKQKIGAVILSTALLLTTATPAFGATSLTISGNGAFSENEIVKESETNNTVVQNNTANISNTVKTDTNTGDNRASLNTGGDVSIGTGDAKALVQVSNTANLNKAVLNDCDCDGADKNLTIKDNGAGSDNDVDLKSENTNDIFQDNTARFSNNIDVDAKTGGNRADKNTGKDGSGAVVILSGDALVDVALTNLANKNVALLGRLGGQNQSGSLNATITGNGADSESEINFDFERNTTLVQGNDAHFENTVDVDAKTGYNTADYNAGGGVFIGTGDAKAFVDVNNAANFNLAALADCGCLVNLNGKIGENGAQTDNKLDFDFDSTNDVFQDNFGHLDNDVESEAKSGKNQANKNTTGNGDPAILTGGSGSLTTVENRANVNLFQTHGLAVAFDLSEVAGFFGI